VLREPTVAGIGQLAAMQTAAPSFEVELQPIDARDVSEFERTLADFAGVPKISVHAFACHFFGASISGPQLGGKIE
jgi:hypothetical protein